MLDERHPHDGYPMLSERVEAKIIAHRKECARIIESLNTVQRNHSMRQLRELINYYNRLLKAYNLVLGDCGRESFKAEVLYRSVNWPDGLARELRLVCGLVDLEIYNDRRF